MLRELNAAEFRNKWACSFLLQRTVGFASELQQHCKSLSWVAPLQAEDEHGPTARLTFDSLLVDA